MRGRKSDERTHFEPCACPAYNWPHRPGGGLCRWPDEPTHRLTTPAGTHEWPRMEPGLRQLARRGAPPESGLRLGALID